MQILSDHLSCCICDRSTSTFWKKIDGFCLMKCTRCALVHLSEVITKPEQFLDEAPTTESLDYWGYPEVFKKYPEIFEFFFNERLKRIQNAQPPAGEWLDIGAGFGLWQNFLKKNDIISSGIEIEKKAQMYCHSLGLDVDLVSIENFSTSKKYAVITICDVLEHVRDPLGVLKKCHELLAPGGLIYIQVPTVLGFRYPYNDSLGLPHHLWQFTPLHLKRLTGQSGLKTFNWWTGVQGVIRQYEEGGPTILTSLLWKIAMMTRRGNRLQLLAKNS